MGEPVEVFVPFDQRWVQGFEVAAVVPEQEGDTVRLRRLSDGDVLPASVPADRVRRIHPDAGA